MRRGAQETPRASVQEGGPAAALGRRPLEPRTPMLEKESSTEDPSSALGVRPALRTAPSARPTRHSGSITLILAQRALRARVRFHACQAHELHELSCKKYATLFER